MKAPGKIAKAKKRTSQSLSKLRAKIDSIDKEILESVNRRASLALDVMEEKAKSSKSVYDSEREKEIVEKIVRLNSGPLADGDAVSIFKEIIRSCRSLQFGKRVSYLGPEGSFSHQAAASVFGASAELVPYKNIEDIFDSVLTGSVSKGVVPIENSTEGSVASVLEIISDTEVEITGEYFERISHFLLSKTGDIKAIKKIASHPQALGQCRKWISANFPNTRSVETSSTAAAAAMAVKDKTVGAVASAYSASIYGLRKVAENIEDSPINATRFVTVEKSGGSLRKIREGNKVSIVFSIKDEPGALHKTLFSPLASAGVNLTRIESRPSGKTAWEYVFFVDFEGSLGQRKTDRLIAEIRKGSSSFKVLGCYFSGSKPRIAK